MKPKRKQKAPAAQVSPAESLFNIALQHHQSGQLGEAERLYREILVIQPRHTDSLHLLGMIAFQCGHLDSAVSLIRQAIQLTPSVALYHSNLGVILNAQGHQDEAVKSYLHAISLKENHIDAHINVGIVFTAQGKYEEAISHFRRALVLNPNHADCYVNLGASFAEQGQMLEAISHYERAIQLKPECAEAFSNLANALLTQNMLDEAIAHYKRALTLKPDYLLAWYNLGNVFQAQNNLPEANACYDRALALKPDYQQARYGKALGQLLEGNFTSGWANYESRWHNTSHRPMRQYMQSRWNGQPIDGNVLIWPEQGIGDEIMFAGLIPDVLKTGTSCLLECEPRLQPLFARSFPSARVVTAPQQDFAAHQPVGSLPALFRSTWESFAATTSPYLVPHAEHRKQLRKRYECGKRLVGLAWHTKNLKTGFSRCLDFSLLSPLFQQPDIFWVSLQYGDQSDLQKTIDAAHAPVWIDPTIDQLKDMDAFASQISALDLVITIDNSTAHLAGALGVPVWVLLPFARDWRWFQGNERSPWYPSMRLFRQPKIADWQSVIEAVCLALGSSIADEPLDPPGEQACQVSTAR